MKTYRREDLLMEGGLVAIFGTHGVEDLDGGLGLSAGKALAHANAYGLCLVACGDWFHGS